MLKHAQKKHAENLLDPLPALPLPHDLWLKIANSMKLSGKLCLVVEYVLRGMSDIQIEDTMEISHSTLRTYFDRIALRTGMRRRVEIFRRVLAVSHGLDI
jgi:DNA-binding NarL/FixJ family response regulator